MRMNCMKTNEIISLLKVTDQNQAHRRIADIICSERGEALSLLKNTIETSRLTGGLVELVFRRISCATSRERIMEHIEDQAITSVGRKIVCDIDDTIYATIKDRRYPKKTVYPGVVSFVHGLQAGAGDRSAGPVVFLTSRPNDPLGMIYDRTFNSLNNLGFSQLTLLLGSVERIWTKKLMAACKLERISLHMTLFPEYDYVMIGDSGFGDILLAGHLRSRFPNRISGTLIHNVTDESHQKRQRLADQDIFLFDHYGEAALYARENQLLMKDLCRRVLSEVRQSRESLTWLDQSA